MPDRAAVDWAARTRRWNAPRVAAAVLLHLLALLALVLGTGRVQLPRPGADRSTTLVSVTLAPSKPPPVATTLPMPKAPVRDPRDARGAPARATAPQPVSEPITLPAPAPQPDAPTIAAAAKPPASAPSTPLPDILNTTSTRQAIRDAARGTTLSALGNAATREQQGSTMTYADGHECPTCTRNLAAPKARGERLTQAVKSAGRPDCLAQSASTGIWALPVLIATEAAGQCSN